MNTITLHAKSSRLNTKMSLFHEYAAKGKKKKLKKLIESGINVDARNANGETALYHAALHSRNRCIKLLLGRGADPNIITEDGLTPVDAAKSKNHSTSLRILLRNGGILFTENERKMLKRINSIDDTKNARSESVPEIDEKDLIPDDRSRSFLICFGRMILNHASWHNHAITIKASTNYQRNAAGDKMNDQSLLANELEILSKLRHENIMKLLATSVTLATNPMMLIFEPIRYGNLADALYARNEKFDDDYVCLVLIKLAKAIDYIHQNSILHNFINSQSVYQCESRVVLGDFMYAQEIASNIMPISHITSQRPWMAPAQSNGDVPDRYSDIYSFGALMWELLARRQPCHWTAATTTTTTTLYEAANDDNAFVFPLDENWSSTLKNILSFCIQTNAERRPEIATIIELLEQEIKRNSTGERDEISIDNGLDNPVENLDNVSVKSVKSFEDDYEETVAFLSSVGEKDFKRLQKKLSTNCLAVVKATRMMNLAKKHERKVWAKESINVKQAEKIYLSRNISHERKKAAKRILQGYAYPLTDNDRLQNIGRFNVNATTRITMPQSRTTKFTVSEKKFLSMRKLLDSHQRKSWAKIVIYEKGFVNTEDQ